MSNLDFKLIKLIVISKPKENYEKLEIDQAWYKTMATAFERFKLLDFIFIGINIFLSLSNVFKMFDGRPFISDPNKSVSSEQMFALLYGKLPNFVTAHNFLLIIFSLYSTKLFHKDIFWISKWSKPARLHDLSSSLNPNGLIKWSFDPEFTHNLTIFPVFGGILGSNKTILKIFLSDKK